MVERPAVFDTQRRQHAAVEPPESHAKVIPEFGLRCSFALCLLDAERGDGNPTQPGEDEGGDQEEQEWPADRAK